MRLLVFAWCLLGASVCVAQERPVSEDEFSEQTLVPFKLDDPQNPQWGGTIFYGNYRLEINNCVEFFIYNKNLKILLFFIGNSTCAGIVDPATCYAVHGSKLLFVLISDGYLTPKTYRVVELSLDKLKYRTLVRGKQVSCPAYTPDGEFLLVTVDGVEKRVRSRFK